MLNLDEKQLKNINSRTNLKKFIDHVLANNVEKVTKMCTKGLDPNFHCAESGGKLWEYHHYHDHINETETKSK